MSSCLRRPVVILLLNLLAVGAIGYLALGRNRFGMFYGGEGIANRIAAHDQYVWMPFGIFVGMIPTIGDGVTGMPFNSWLMPAFLLQDIVNAGDIEALPTYLVMALELFVSIFFLGRALRLGLPASLLGGWIVLLLMTPFVRPNYLAYPVTHIVPLFGELVAAACLGGAMFLSIGRHRPLVDAALCAGWVVLLGWMVASDIMLFPLAVPCLALFALAGIVGAATKAELRWKIAALLVAAGLLTLGGFPQIVVGSYRDTATGFFGHEFINNVTSDPVYISILFQGTAYSFVGPALAVLGLAGGVGYFFWNRAYRVVNLVLVAGIAAMIGGGYLLCTYTTYYGPKILYFEFAFWPLYCLWVAWAIVSVSRWPLEKIWPTRNRRFAAHLGVSVVAWLMTIVIVFGIAGEPTDWGYLHHPTPIIDYLEPRIALHPGDSFRGRVASFTGYVGQPPGIDWTRLDDVNASAQKLGNEHRFTGFWRYGIPALFEDSAFTSPAIYAIASRLLARPGDRQMRNIMLFTRPDPSVLQLLGVRYILTDDDAVNVGDERFVMPWEAMHRKLRLLELPHPNLGQYSPVKVVPYDDWRQVIDQLQQGLDPAQAVMVDLPLSGEALSAAEDVHLFFAKGYLRIHATSPGRSAIVLPIEYSHCLVVEAGAGSGSLSLFRADLVNAGIDFTGTIDARLKLRVGPLRQSTCRTFDADDMMRLKMP